MSIVHIIQGPGPIRMDLSRLPDQDPPNVKPSDPEPDIQRCLKPQMKFKKTPKKFF
jgi:hypothetical protein